MMPIQVNNFTPFANLRYSNLDAQRREFGVLIIKATYDVGADGICALSDEQEPLALTDEYVNAVNTSPLRYPSDLVPFKPKTDIIFDTVARAPGGVPTSNWLFRVHLKDQTGVVLEKTLRVTGPRYWLPRWRRTLSEKEIADWRRCRHLFVGWELSDPEPVTEVPIRYDLAYGGLLPKGEDDCGQPIVEAYQHNPIGRGWIDREWTDHTKAQPAPQIEDPAIPVCEAYRHYEPCGLGPIPPAWLPRRPLGGTYDQDWIDSIWPYWPADYDFEFHNSASLELRSNRNRYIDGRIEISIDNCLPQCHKETKYCIAIPNPTLLLTLYDASEAELETIRLNLDTIFLDEDNPTQSRVMIVGRFVFNEQTISRINIHRIKDRLLSTRVPINAIFPAAAMIFDI